MPFIVELLKFLAAENQLTSVYEKAKEKSIALQKKKEERKAGLVTNSFLIFFIFYRKKSLICLEGKDTVASTTQLICAFVENAFFTYNP